MTEILPCPMCGSSASIDSTGALECYGKTWQTLYLDCNLEKDKDCGMSLNLQADFWNIRNAQEQLIKCWNGLDRK